MDETEITKKATQRRAELELDYAGAVTPPEAHYLADNCGAVIVDVRTDPEYHYVGRPHGSVLVNWQQYPGMEINEQFLDQLEQQASKDKTVLFLCRSGVRSHHAASIAVQAGWSKAYNVLEGFEGDLDSEGHRGNSNGWRFHDLPWEQS